MDPWWEQIDGSKLAQGDYLQDCVVPSMPPDFEPPEDEYGGPYEFDGTTYDVIVVTQSCDLENDKAPLVATCPVFTLADFETANPAFQQKGRWEMVRQGRIEGLHLLAALQDPTENRQALVIDFRQIYSLPIAYLEARATKIGTRHRLLSPYVEHFSQSFARFFMRVGLPSNIPVYR